MNLIVAVDSNWGIGKDGDLLTHLSGDLKYFKETTMDKVVIMGRKTLESLPGKKGLPGRINIVLTRDKDYAAKDCMVFSSWEELEKEIVNYEDENIFLIGGECIYRDNLNLCDALYITKVYEEFDADKHMINVDELDEYEVTWKGDLIEEKGIKYQFFKYERKKDV